MIDLRSDSVTQPTKEMREAARDADVGHVSYGGDPTVEELEATAAETLGTEASLFLPSGTMANQIAARTHTQRGQEVILELSSHMYNREATGLAQVSNLQTRPIDGGKRGVITPDLVCQNYVEKGIRHPGTGLLCLENTHNVKGGTAISPEKIEAAAETSHEYGVPVHLDGARLFQAMVAHDCPIEKFVKSVDSVYVDLAKIGAPGGAILAGNRDFIQNSLHQQKLYGGYIKQGGIVAAPALIALSNIGQIEEDQNKATKLAKGLDKHDKLEVQFPETNIVFINTSGADMTAAEFVAACEEKNVFVTAFGKYRTRLVTHRDVEKGDIETVIERIQTIV